MRPWKILEATTWAIQWHGDQKRKYTGEPYVLHPLAVAKLVMNFSYTMSLDPNADPGEHVANMVAAAILHDVLEDTDVSERELRVKFGDVVTDMVIGLTDHFTKDAYPELNRAQRKKAERVLLAAQPKEGQFIKACDILDNLADIAEHDADFAKVYIDECAETLAVLNKIPAVFHDYVNGKLEGAKETMT